MYYMVDKKFLEYSDAYSDICASDRLLGPVAELTGIQCDFGRPWEKAKNRLCWLTLLAM